MRLLWISRMPHASSHPWVFTHCLEYLPNTCILAPAANACSSLTQLRYPPHLLSQESFLYSDTFHIYPRAGYILLPLPCHDICYISPILQSNHYILTRITYLSSCQLGPKSHDSSNCFLFNFVFPVFSKNAYENNE